MNVSEIVADLVVCHRQTEMLGFRKATEWACGLLSSVPEGTEIKSLPKGPLDFELDEQYNSRSYKFAKNLFYLGQYKRSAYHLRNAKQNFQQHRCLYYHSRYMALDTDRLNFSSEGESVSNTIKHVIQKINEVLTDLEKDLKKIKTDSWILCIYSLYLLKMNRVDQARVSLLSAIRLDPLNWPAWDLLSSLIVDKYHLKSLNIPNHWIKWFFLGNVYMRLHMFEEAHDLYTNVIKKVFPTSTYVISRISVAQNELRDIEAAIDNFQEVRSLDPYRLDDMDVYSNALYVSQRRYELASLAHFSNEIEPFRYETCFCLANFYSLRGQHDKAATYFARALKFDATNVSAWILTGHEFMEMKKTEDAIKAYRSAINLDRTDPRAWYGLGQLYEILKLPNISLENYLEAHKLKPRDTRITIALADTYEKLEWYGQALTYYRRAGGAGLSKLAPLLEKLNKKEEALAAYTQFLDWLRQTDAYDPHSNPEILHAEKYIENARSGSTNSESSC